MSKWLEPQVVAELLSAAGTFTAALVAVLIAIASERGARRRAEADRQALLTETWRSRKQNMLTGLLVAIEQDRDFQSRDVRALLRSLRSERNWVGTAWDIWVEGRAPTDPEAARTQVLAEVGAALEQLEAAYRVPMPAAESTAGKRRWRRRKAGGDDAPA